MVLLNTFLFRGLQVDPDTLSQREREFSGDNERQKGNDCFRAGEFEDALLYYSRCLLFCPDSTAALANRCAQR